MSNMHYCVIGIEMGMTCASKIVLLATFSKLEEAQHFINNNVKGKQYSLIDILETYIDQPNAELQNVIHLN